MGVCVYDLILFVGWIHVCDLSYIDIITIFSTIQIGVGVGVEIASAEDFNKKSAEQIAAEIAISQVVTKSENDE